MVAATAREVTPGWSKHAWMSPLQKWVREKVRKDRRRYGCEDRELRFARREVLGGSGFSSGAVRRGGPSRGLGLGSFTA